MLLQIIVKLLSHLSLTISCILLLSYNSFSQNLSAEVISYYALINQAELAIEDNQRLLGDSLYKQAFESAKKAFAQDFFQAAQNAYHLDNAEKCLIYLNEAFGRGLQLGQIKNKTELYLYIQENGFRKKDYTHKRKIYLKTLDRDQQKTINQLIKRDQRVRSGKYNRMTWKKQQPLMKSADSLNFIVLHDLCKKKGFPGYHTLGENRTGKYNITDVALLMRHMDSVQLSILEPFILEAISTFELDVWAYTSALDYTSMFKTSIEDRSEAGFPIMIVQQVYGTMSYTNDAGEKQLFAVENIKKSNQLRASLGMCTIEEEAKKRGVLMPDEGFYRKEFR